MLHPARTPAEVQHALDAALPVNKLLARRRFYANGGVHEITIASEVPR